jgi:photosystem II stability/assembly factor-like uncharacterized protein
LTSRHIIIGFLATLVTGCGAGLTRGSAQAGTRQAFVPNRCAISTIALGGRFTTTPTVGTVFGLAMVSAPAGWMMATQAVLTTADGGQTWRIVFAPHGQTLTAGWFFSARTAVVETKPASGAPDALYATNNGGRTWRHTGQVPPAVTVAQFVDPREGWAVWQGPAAAGSGAFKLLRTTDGGRTWRLLWTIARGAGGSGVFGWVRFETPEDGWLARWITGFPGFTLARTTDGGRTWHTERLPVLGNGRTLKGFTLTVLQPPTFRGPVGVMAAWANGSLIVYRSEDSGAAWTLGRASGIRAVPPNMDAGTPPVAWVTAQQGWLGPLPAAAPADGAMRYVIYDTADGGRTWVIRTRVTGLGWQTTASLDAVTPDIAWLVIRRKDSALELWKTVDGGCHWTLQPAPTALVDAPAP